MAHLEDFYKRNGMDGLSRPFMRDMARMVGMIGPDMPPGLFS